MTNRQKTAFAVACVLLLPVALGMAAEIANAMKPDFHGFDIALRHLKQGGRRKVRRNSWCKGIYLILIENAVDTKFYMGHESHGRKTIYSLSVEDLEATDWVIF